MRPHERMSHSASRVVTGGRSGIRQSGNAPTDQTRGGAGVRLRRRTERHLSVPELQGPRLLPVEDGPRGTSERSA